MYRPTSERPGVLCRTVDFGAMASDALRDDQGA